MIMKKTFSYFLVALFAFSFFVFSAPIVGAQEQIGLPSIPDVTAEVDGANISPVKDFTLEKGVGIIALVLKVAYIIFFIVAALFIIFAAWDYLQAGGGEGTKEAQKKLIYALIAIAIALLSFGITSFVSNILNR